MLTTSFGKLHITVICATKSLSQFWDFGGVAGHIDEALPSEPG